MVERVRQRRRNGVVVLGRDDHEGIGAPVERREPLKRLRRLALRMLLVHAVEEREVQLHRVDERRLVPAFREPPDDVAGRPDALPVGPDAAEDHGNAEGHADSLAGRSPRAKTRTAAPTSADITEPTRTPTFTSSSSSGEVGKARRPMKRLIVKPMPQRSETP